MGNVRPAVAQSYGWLMVARFLSGLPHGAYFGVGAVVAASLVSRDRRTWAVSMMLIGLTVANVIGVPLTTMLGQQIGWQAPYWVVGVIGAVTVLAVWRWVPCRGTAGSASMLGELGRAQAAAGLVRPADRGGRVRRHVRDLRLHRADDDRAARLQRAFVPVLLGVYGLGMVSGVLLGRPYRRTAPARHILGLSRDRADAGRVRDCRTIAVAGRS